MRSFVALPISQPDLADELYVTGQSLRLGRVVAQDNLHLTLAFLDDQPEAKLRELHEGLMDVSAPPLQLTFTGLDIFGGSRPRLAYAAVRPDSNLVALRDEIRNVARLAGINLNRERFVPHVTLVRFSRNDFPQGLQNLAHNLAAASSRALPSLHVEEFVLFQSRLFPDGPRYDRLAAYPLGD